MFTKSNSNSLLIFYSLRFFLSFWFSFGRLYTSRNLSVSSNVVSLFMIVHSSLLSLDISLVRCSVFSFICNFISQDFSFFLHLQVCQFNIIFSTPLFILLTFSIFVGWSLLHFFPDMIDLIFLLLLNLSLVFFPGSFGCTVRLWESFLFFIVINL